VKVYLIVPNTVIILIGRGTGIAHSVSGVHRPGDPKLENPQFAREIYRRSM